MKIISITIQRELDLNPDISFLGTFAHEGLNRHFAFGDTPRSGEYPCWIPSGRHDVIHEWEYVEADYWHHVGYLRGDWIMLEIFAEAVVEINGERRTVRSEGTRNIESDHDPSFMKQIEKGERQKLNEVLDRLMRTEAAKLQCSEER